MNNRFAFALIAAVIFCAPSLALAEDDTPLPFSVLIGGQRGQLKAGEANFATIEKPVPATAALEVDAKADMIIVNVVGADEKGEVNEGATPAIIIIQNGNKTTLDKTMDRKPLAAGNYLLAAVADGKTASVFFKIQ